MPLLYPPPWAVRPLGGDSFFINLEALLGRTLRPKKPEPKKKQIN
jgi:hypothetical protein